MTEPQRHLIRLGGSPWSLWRLSAVRSSGFPVECLAAITDDELADVTEQETGTGPPSAEYRRRYLDSFANTTDHLARLGQDPRFREALLWQSPHLLGTCVDKIAPGTPDRLPGSKQRQRLLTTAAYLQRYVAKNDSIGFFGPVGWARWTARPEAVSTSVGRDLLARRTVYFEAWAVDAVAQVLSRDPDLLPWLRPALAPHHARAADDLLLEPTGRPVPLDELETALVARCDGRRSVREISAEVVSPALTNDAVVAAFVALADRGVISLGLDVPVSTWPEEHLRTLLGGLAESPARANALARLTALTDARDEVAAAAGDTGRLAHALSALDSAFERIAGRAPTRRPGQNYAGRTPVYEDAVRDVDIELGGALHDALAEPLALLLHSARWLANATAEAYRTRFDAVFDRLRARTGADEVPLALFYGAATPDLVFSFREPPAPVAEVLAEFQRRWRKILELPSEVDSHRVASAEIADAVTELFACSGPQWSAAVHHSPDVMIAADSQEAINRGDFVAVLGELHVATNTLASRLFVEQSPDPGWLLRADEHDHGGRRVVVVPAKASSQVNSRTYPAALVSPEHTYWAMHPDAAITPPGTLPAGALRVLRQGNALVVRDVVSGRVFDLLEVFGEILSGTVMNSFELVPPGRHRPRVTIDTLVVSRETWAFDSTDLSWPHLLDGTERFRQAWRWHRDQGLPRRCFYRVAVEDKPLYVDFASVVLVDLLARAVRRADGHTRAIVFSEPLPDFRQTWLRDGQDRRYTCELRLVAVDPAVADRRENAQST
ncbi:lantibiotic dehydratase [Lentzea sp. JNUCC 0626]|uniref:lantibiotic dehydratase n=1 Tax=Lentzea sp. JNUCC 0626 TaxID=3367513 RepID=UPI0037490FB5